MLYYTGQSVLIMKETYYFYTGGSQTEPAQEVHTELTAVWGRRGWSTEGQKHQTDGAGGRSTRGYRPHGGTFPLPGPPTLHHGQYQLIQVFK